MRKVWVLNWRLELEEDSNQTEDVWPELFYHKVDALRFAQKAAAKVCKTFGRKAEPDELHQLFLDLAGGRRGRTMHVFYLTDSDNLVFELSLNKIREK